MEENREVQTLSGKDYTCGWSPSESRVAWRIDSYNKITGGF